MKNKNDQRKKDALSLKHFLLITLGILMTTVGIYFFKAPNGFATGGVSGIAILLEQLNIFGLGITQGTYLLTINVFLLLLGAIILGKQCGILTIYCSMFFSLGNYILEIVLPIEKITGGRATLTNDPMLELVFAILLTGIGSALLFRYKASSGGTDIVALILKKYTNLNVSTALLTTDFIVAFSTIFISGITTGLYSLLGLFAKVFVIDDILDSLNMCKSFTIITTKSKEINEYIVNEMRHGATVFEAEGAYTQDDKQIIMTVCKRSEALKLRRMVKEIDPHSFIIITKTSEISGKGFRDSQ